jgi:quinol monooxygenase YgiN
MSKVFLHVEVDVQPGKFQDFLLRLKSQMDLIRVEAGCEYIEAFDNEEQPDLIHIWEIWCDRPAWDAHMANARSTEWRKVASEFVIEERVSILKQL